MVRARFAEGKPYGVVVIAEGLAEFLPAEEIKKCIPEDQFRRAETGSLRSFPGLAVEFLGATGPAGGRTCQAGVRQGA